jgi:hypothetical protein
VGGGKSLPLLAWMDDVTPDPPKPWPLEKVRKHAKIVGLPVPTRVSVYASRESLPTPTSHQAVFASSSALRPILSPGINLGLDMLELVDATVCLRYTMKDWLSIESLYILSARASWSSFERNDEERNGLPEVARIVQQIGV